MHYLILIVDMLLAIGLIVLMAVQTDKAEQGGVMGLGAAGGRTTGSVDLPVGAERILKPLTRWVMIGFLFVSVLAAVPQEQMTPYHPLIMLVIYLVIMTQGARIWNTVTGVKS